MLATSIQAIKCRLDQMLLQRFDAQIKIATWNLGEVYVVLAIKPYPWSNS